MSAAFYQITDIEQGADWSMPVNLQTETGSAINLTGCSLKMQVRTGSVDAGGSVLANLTSSNGGITVLSAPNGQIRLSLTANQTASIPNANYFYDLFLLDASGKQSRLLEGGAVVLPRYTT
jgi:hypothetical protein